MDTRIIGWTLVFVLFTIFLRYNETSFNPKNKVEQVDTQEKEVPLFERLRGMRRDKVADNNLLNVGYSTPGLFDDENEISLENDKMKVCFSTTGGVIEKVMLKDYKSYGGGNVVLCTGDSIIENLNIKIKNALEKNKGYDVCHFPFTVHKTVIGDKEAVEFLYDAKLHLENESKFIVKNVFYFDNISEYVLQHEIEIEDVNEEIDSVQYQLNNLVRQQEKNLQDCQLHTTIKYLDFEDDSRHELNSYSDSAQEEECKKARWVNIMQKFFSFSISSEEGLNNVKVILSTPSDDKAKKGEDSNSQQDEKKVRIKVLSDDQGPVVKEASVLFDVEKSFQKDGKNKFKKKIRYYFGPNDVYIMREIGNKLEESIYLGWPVARQISKYLYLPLIKKMEEKHIPAWILIIVLILLLTLFLSPFFITGYLGKLRMDILNPYLEEVQKKHGDDFFAAVEERRKITSAAKVNTLGFLFANLMQIPFWNSVYNVFQYSMVFRQKHFLWCDDMSTYDSVLNFKFNLPLFGDHVSIFALLMLLVIVLQVLFSQGNLKMSGVRAAFMIAIALFILRVNNNMCVCFTFYFFVSSFLTIILQKCIDAFIDKEKIKTEIDSILRKEGLIKK